ncbi:MAG: hypothetical protein K5931_03215 [Lachnospiraceae bacterium]|nr:hypothetical protein [Lachnospiraceae bacterium]
MANEVKKFEDMTEEEQKEYLKLKGIFEDQASKLGEIYSQCWESDEFKQAFISDPKAIFDEYGVNYDKNKNYKVIDTPDKTVIKLLPYKGIKAGLKSMADSILKSVEDLSDDEEKQIILEGWKWEVIQNTEDTYYLAIPISPEKLTPEELEMVNGGCLIFAIVFLVQSIASVTTVSVATEIAVAALLVALLAVDVAAAFSEIGLVFAGAVLAVAETLAVVHLAAAVVSSNDDKSKNSSGTGAGASSIQKG